jgi:hypothetical protein
MGGAHRGLLLAALLEEARDSLLEEGSVWLVVGLAELLFVLWLELLLVRVRGLSKVRP